MSIPKKLLDDLLALSPTNKVELVEFLLASLHAPEKEVDRLWHTSSAKYACSEWKKFFRSTNKDIHAD